ncbi:MAG: hypothetical protein ACE5K9_11035 [Candidatus Methylomirabilales bacterium]
MRQALDYHGTLRAVVVGGLGWLVYVVLVYILLLLLGGGGRPA